MRFVAVAVLLLTACKEKGPSEQERAARDKAERAALCEKHGAKVKARWEEVQALRARVKETPAVQDDVVPARPVRFRQLHFREPQQQARADVNFMSDFEGPKRGLLGTCSLRIETCGEGLSTYELGEQLEGCASIDTLVLIRPLVHDEPELGKDGTTYRGGTLVAEAFVFALGVDAGAATLGQVIFEAELTGDVEVMRVLKNGDRGYVLNEELRKTALGVLEKKLQR